MSPRESRCSFRRLAEVDLPLLHCWLNAPHVLEWWDRPGPTLDEVRAKYLPRVEGASDATPYIMCLDGVPIGYIQLYPVHDGAWGVHDVRSGVGLDLFIGDAGYLRRGLGPRILKAFLREVAFRDRAVEACFVDPSPRNRIAIRAFEKAGFRHMRIAAPQSAPEAHLMQITRDEVEGLD